MRADEANIAYFSARTELPGVSLFIAERPDAPEFDLAVVYRVEPASAEVTLRRIVRHFRNVGRVPRVRLAPTATPADWPACLEQAGFIETTEGYVFNLVPETLDLATNPAVTIRRAVTPGDADQFSAIHVAAFAIPSAHRAWDRDLARRHLAKGNRAFYLASLDGTAVGASAMCLVDGVATLSGLATLPVARGQGVGGSLIQRRVADARATGSTVIVNTALAGGYAAGLYQRLGLVSLFTTRTFVLRE